MRLFLLFVLGGIFFFKGPVSYASTLDDVRERDYLICGVDEQNYGFAYVDEHGRWVGFEVDFCRALAVAVLGSAEKVQFISLNAQTRFSALSAQQIDILLRSTTWTYTRDIAYGVDYPGVTYYDQLGILAHKSIGYTAFSEVEEATLCVANGTTTLESVQEYVHSSGRKIKIKVFNSREGLSNFFFSGQCDLYAADRSALQAILTFSAPNPNDYVLLQATLSKEPLGPVVRDDDREWYDIVKWLVYGLIEAEERGVTRRNVEEMRRLNNHAVRFMLGGESGFGKALRLPDSWLYDVIRAQGNYGEIFERNLGSGSQLKIERGLNNLWQKGGLMYAMPIR
ncbi:amino acid ABC transporter substrate-binding protein [Terasakiella brassicae]|uniref:Amino acid ABC transporter substrate-binding protein n=1 Tax=Terasakiella brassicae TaxID=1634917 RepID=A0A917BRL9_9PROT|nr:amino acid ABC transporter substrate-binding protein [Terasakiella brassicae]GGF54345.1 amino acid ABC transporter substrate-binding protein [Terasakiella brassicae]